MSITICLSRPGPFHPGEILEGKVICQVFSTKKIKGIHLKMKGEEQTCWTKQESSFDSRNDRQKLSTVNYSGINDFMSLQMKLSGEGMICTGRYEYPFQFVVPICVPSSFEGVHGYIRFSLGARMEIPWDIDSRDDKFFHVFTPVNFNVFLSPTELNPVKYENQTTGWFSRDPVKMEVYLNKKAFILGEKISIKINITNMSNNSVQELVVKLKRRIVEKCKLPSHDEKSETKTILETVYTGVGAHGERLYNVELQLTNSLELPNFKNSQLFSLSHSLEVEAKVSGFQQNIEIEKGITLGHIPLGVSTNYSGLTTFNGTTNRQQVCETSEKNVDKECHLSVVLYLVVLLLDSPCFIDGFHYCYKTIQYILKSDAGWLLMVQVVNPMEVGQ